MESISPQWSLYFRNLYKRTFLKSLTPYARIIIGPERTARDFLNTGKWADRGRRCRCRYAVEIDRISSHTFL